MISEIQQLTDEYHSWLKEKTNLRVVDDHVEITTPYLDRHNDCIQIYVKRTDDGFVLTDDGATIDDLELSGCSMASPKRKQLLQMTLNGFGVGHEDNELLVKVSPKTFALKKHNLVQAMLAVNDLFYLATPMVASLFLEDVEAWLRISNIRFVSNIKMSGRSGYDHLFNFVIPSSISHPERVILLANNPNRSNTHQVVFSWEDTREARGVASRAYVLLNDQDKQVSESVLIAYRNYDVTPVQWSLRESVREELAA